MANKILGGVAFAALSLAAGAAHAQSTASQIAGDEIVITAHQGGIDGVMNAEHAPRSRSTIGQEFIGHQTAGQSILQSINLIPGVNFTNTDPYGSAGGNVRIRGFDGARVSLTFDGVPLNDTGNYAIYPNQMLDPELIERANVNLGSTDIDSPTASATGGTINYVTVRPLEEAGLTVQPSIGSDDYYRLFTRVDTGEFGPWNTTAFGAFSYQTYDQFIGSGDLEKVQANARIFQPLHGDDFMSLAFHWNRNRNDFYRTGTLAAWQFYGHDGRVNLSSCTRDTTAVAGATDDSETPDGTHGGAYLDAADNPANPKSCDNYYGVRINPSDTGNIRGQSRFTLADGLTLTIDPTVQYTMANGGGTTVVSETDARLMAGTGIGVDLNGDNDTLDKVRLYSPSNTNTLRYAVLSSLIWDIADHQRLIFGYTYDTGRHRQTGEYDRLDANGDPLDVFGGKDGFGGDPILTRAGTVFQKRNRLSVATLSQWSVRYVGDYFDDAITIDAGLRAPQFERNLDQRCYSTAGSSGDAVCAAGYVPSGVAPFKTTVTYDDILPNFGIVFRPAEGQQVFFSYSEGLSAPRTDDLYNGLSPAQLDEIKPETSSAYDLGYRYQAGGLLFSSTLWYNAFANRIVRVFDQDQGINISRNVGDVNLWGAELEVGYNFTDSLSGYFSAAWTESEVQDDLPAVNGAVRYTVPTRGKELVDTPNYTAAARLQYESGPITLGLQGKYVGERWATDANDQRADAYTVFDFDARWDLGTSWDNRNTYLQLNVMNLFDEDYFGSLSSQICSVTAPGDCESGTRADPTYNLGAPRTVMLSLRTQF